MRTRILCTLGPSSFRPDVIAQLDQRGVHVFRINLSHTRPDEVETMIELVRASSTTPICIDTEGAQIRCGVVAPGLSYTSGEQVVLTSAEVVGGPEALQLRPAAAVDTMRVGHRVDVDFDGVVLRVTAVGAGSVETVVEKGGRVGSNKAVTLHPAPQLPALTEHDRASIELARGLGILHYALSFASCAQDVALLRELLPEEAVVMAKIETRAGLEDVDGIIQAADAVIIDRGDLSREIPIEYVPIYQKHIVRRANAWNTPVYVATNLLESMVVNRTPTLAEANDIINTLVDGAHGLVLAAETAIGSNPIDCMDMVLRLIDAFEQATGGLAVPAQRRPAAVA